uniref:Odorant receptor n=1 Tax=Helicoverpa gelotopoeon TaxID=38040 RepID=A0A8E4HT91_HELGL|nr:olfactory receptor OR6 [Helicoverpa gelotopoeon]
MSFKKFLFENEPVDGINGPSDYLYIKILRFTLDVIRSWPRKELGEPESARFTVFMKYFYLVLTIATVVGSILYVVVHVTELSFLEAGFMYLIILMSIVDALTVMSLTFSAKYRVLAKDFLTKIHLFYYKDRSKDAMEIHKKVHLISHLFSLWLLFQMLSGLSLFNLTPMYSNLAAGKYRRGGLGNTTFEHSLYYLYPFNTSTDVIGYVVACILHWIISYLCSTWFCMFNLFISLMVFNLWGHFKILIITLEEFPRPKSIGTLQSAYKYSQEELVDVAERLKDCINYHREIKNFTNRMSDVFGPMLLVYYSFHQASGCLLLLECSVMTAQALIRYLPLTIILTQQLIQLSVVFELVGSESEKLKDAVYGVPWECMDTKNRRMVSFFLMNVQEPIHVKAMGIADVGVTTMAAILKTSMSYFTFLRSM